MKTFNGALERQKPGVTGRRPVGSVVICRRRGDEPLGPALLTPCSTTKSSHRRPVLVVDKAVGCEHFGGDNVIIAGQNFEQSRNEHELFMFSRCWREPFRPPGRFGQLGGLGLTRRNASVIGSRTETGARIAMVKDSLGIFLIRIRPPKLRSGLAVFFACLAVLIFGAVTARAACSPRRSTATP